QGCHILEGFGGSIRSLAADTSLAPPIIQGEGAKVQSDWLFAFLKAPKTGQIRPWLEVHMPTFGFTDQELNDLTRYFAFLQRTSPLAALVDAPAFAKDRAEFAQLLGGDEQAKTFLGDPDAVTKALRDYVWSIGVNGGTGPAASAPPAEGQPAPAPATRAAGR